MLSIIIEYKSLYTVAVCYQMSEPFNIKHLPAPLQKRFPWIVSDTILFYHEINQVHHGPIDDFKLPWTLISLAHFRNLASCAIPWCQMPMSCLMRACASDHQGTAKCSDACSAGTHAVGCTRVPHCPVCGGVERNGVIQCTTKCSRAEPFVRPMNTL